MKSILLIGQSNMAGRGFLHETTPICNERIFMLRNGRWQMMDEPVHFDRAVAGVGPAASFAGAWCMENEGETIGLIPCAEGGSSVDEWDPAGILFRHAVSEARYAMENSGLAAILWHQGESDSHSGRYREYEGKLDAVVQGFRKELDAWNVPFIMGGLADFLGKRAFGMSCPEYQKINSEIQKYAENHENCYFVTGDQLFSNPDGIHINAESQRRFGLRYFEAFRTGKHIYRPLPDENHRVQELLDRRPTEAERKYAAFKQFAAGKISYEEAMKV